MDGTKKGHFTDLERHMIAALVYARTGRRISIDTIARWEVGLTLDSTSRRIEDAIFDEGLGHLLRRHYYRRGFVEDGGTSA